MPTSRLGDNLKQYIAGKWMAHKLGLLLLFRPFKHCKELSLATRQRYQLDDSLSKWFGINVFGSDKQISVEGDLISSSVRPGICEMPFLGFDPKIDWSDETF